MLFAIESGIRPRVLTLIGYKRNLGVIRVSAGK
jgi:hypothetical protein